MYLKNFQNFQYNSIYDLNQRENSILYFQLKNKYNYFFTENEKSKFFNNTLSKLDESLNFKNSEFLIIPETSNNNLLELARLTNKKIFCLEKNNKETILKKINSESMMKSEKEKLLNSLNSMHVIKIAEIAGNQRKRFVSCLFKEFQYEINNSAIFFDDSIFSGYTFLAAQNKISHLSSHNFILFDKNIN